MTTVIGRDGGDAFRIFTKGAAEILLSKSVTSLTYLPHHHGISTALIFVGLFVLGLRKFIRIIFH